MTTVTADRESVDSRQISKRRLWFLSAGTVVFLALCAAAAFLGTHWPFTQAKVTQAVQQNWSGEVNVGQFRRTYFPRPGCVLENVTLNGHSSAAGDAMPLVSIRAATVEANYHDLLFRPGYLSRIVLEGLHVYVPPQPADSATNAGQRQSPITEPQQTAKSDSSSTRLGEVFTKEAVLEVARQEDSPLKFDIHQLDLQTIQKDSPMSYELAMRNAVPPGEIQSRGKIGPWDSSHLESLPVSGDYTFENADLGVFQGIAGIASARGEFKGVLGKIETQGTTDTRKFEVTRSKHPVPIKTKFDALVDGMNGNTILRSLEATISLTAAHAEGTVNFKPGQHGKTAVVNITVRNGHIDDVLRMFVREPKPPMEGATNFKAHVVLPPDHRSFTKRVVLQGEFEISHAQWTKESRQASVNTLSKRASGNKKNRTRQMLRRISMARFCSAKESRSSVIVLSKCRVRRPLSMALTI